MLSGLSGDPIQNIKVPLDSNIITALMGSYLRCDPENSAYVLPEFRLPQLVDFCMPSGSQYERNKVFHGNCMLAPQLLESSGCVAVLCMYLFITPNVNSTYAHDVCRVVQAVMADALLIMNDDGNTKQHLLLQHPYTLFDKPTVGGNSGNGGSMLDAFRSANHTAKDILRDMVKLVREARDKKGFQRAKMDCWQAHSLYYLCGLGLSHFGVVVASTGNINAVAGTMESMVLLASLRPKPYSSSKDVYRPFKEEPTRFYLCFENLVQVAVLCCRRAFDGRCLSVGRMFNRRIVAAATHPNCEFARLKCLELKAAFIGTPNQGLIEDANALEAARCNVAEYVTTGAADVVAAWYHERPSKKGGVDLGAGGGLDKTRGEWSEPSSASSSRPGTHSGAAVTDLGTSTAALTRPATGKTDISDSTTRTSTPSSPAKTLRSRISNMYGADEDTWQPDEPEYQPGQEPWRKKDIFARAPRKSAAAGSNAVAQLVALTGTRKAAVAAESSVKREKEMEHEIDEFWSMNKNLRPLYFATRVLRRKASVLPMMSSDWRPRPRFSERNTFDFYTNPLGGLRGKTKLGAAKDVEARFYSDYREGICPRHMNPSMGLFWISTMLLEYAYQTTLYGGGFNKDAAAAKKRTLSDQTMTLSMLEAHGMRGGAGLVVPTKITSTAHAAAGGKSCQTGHFSKRRVKGVGSLAIPEELDIFQKLQLVSRQARSMCSVDSMHRQQRMQQRTAAKQSLPRLQRTDAVLRSGTRTMKTVATEQSDIFTFDSDDLYSDTDDSDDYSDTESGSNSRSGSDDNDDDCASSSNKASSRRSSKASSHRSSKSGDHSGSQPGGRNYSNSGVSRGHTRVVEAVFDPMMDITDPFVQLALMQNDDTNVLGQSIEESYVKDPLQYLLEQSALSQVTQFRKKLKKQGLVRGGAAHKIAPVAESDRRVSVAWSPEANTANAAIRASASIGKLSKSEQAKQYVDQVLTAQRARAVEQEAEIKLMEDSQDMEVSKSKAFIAGRLHEARENRRLESLENAAIVANQLEFRKHELKQKAQAIRLDNKRKMELESIEKARIADIVQWKNTIEMEEKMVKDERFAMEAIRLRKMLDEKEHQEILRRNREEARMKYLEEKRRFIENKDLFMAAAAAAILEEKRASWKKEIRGVAMRVRNGSFQPENRAGKLGFYDWSRPEPIDYVQFEDEQGVSYYYDPVLKKTTYEVPNDAGIHHHTVDDRIAYDKIHGAGAYDAHVFNEMMIASVNENGGYFNHDGVWEEVNGFYDKDGRFWDLDKGYFDEAGDYILYPEVTGTLDFMV